MKHTLALITLVLFCFAASAQNKAAVDSTTRKQESKNTTHSTGSNNQTGTNPIDNKVSLSDPGMPAQKPNTQGKSASSKPTDRKKKSSSGINPK